MSIMRPGQRSAHQTDYPLITEVHVSNYRTITNEYHRLEAEAGPWPSAGDQFRLDNIRREVGRIGLILMDRALHGDALADSYCHCVATDFVEVGLWG